MFKSSDRNSSSMFPLILPKDKPNIIKFASYKTNDIIALNKEDGLVVHRLIYIHPQKKYIVTKGDNNLVSDSKLNLQDILGGVRTIKRGSQKVEINHLYLSQSINYLRQLTRINQVFSINHISYVILKGLPLHLRFMKEPPKRLYLDADLLIKKKNLKKAERILKNMGFVKIPLTLFGKPVEKTSQIHFKKDTKPFPVVIDLHLEPAISFTKVTAFNKLLPKIDEFTKYLFNSIQRAKIEKSNFPILKTETLILYLLLNFYHHNFNGIHRLELINTIIKRGKINWDNISKLAKKFKFENLIYPVFLMLKRYFHTKISNDFIKSTAPPFFTKLISSIIANSVAPFNRGDRVEEGIKRFIFLIILSPSPITQKLKAIFQKETLSYILPSIKSLLLSSETKSSKSVLA